MHVKHGKHAPLALSNHKALKITPRLYCGFGIVSYKITKADLGTVSGFGNSAQLSAPLDVTTTVGFNYRTQAEWIRIKQEKWLCTECQRCDMLWTVHPHFPQIYNSLFSVVFFSGY